MSPVRSRAFLGIDIGTSGAKGVLVDRAGTVLRSAVREHTVDRPHPGHVEMDGRIWWDEFVSIARELIDPDEVEVAGVGVSGMGPSALLTDADGEPVRPAILYGVDTRTAAQIERLNAAFGEEQLLRRCHCGLSSQATGPKLLWVHDHEPEAAARARRLFMPASYLAFRLTGAYVLDHPSASQSPPMYDADGQQWDPEGVAAVAPGLELPTLRRPGEASGTVTTEAARLIPGLREGTPVITGTIDAWSEAVSVGADQPGDLMVMYGTTSFVIATTDHPVIGRSLWGTSGFTEGTYGMAGGMATSGAITSWLRDLTGAASHPELIAEAQRSPAGANGLLMLPYFSGERSPITDPQARGVFAGLTLSHTRGDMYRAALEATGMGIRHHLDELHAAGIEPTRVVAVGGGTQGGLLPQIVSDVTGLTQEIPTFTIGACYGDAVMAARLSDGIDTSHWNPAASVRTPDTQVAEVYDELYGLYRELYPATRRTVHALGALHERGLSGSRD